jgi:hypothetical protein
MRLLKYCLLLAVATIGISSVSAQELKKAVLAVEEFSYSREYFDSNDSEILRNQLISAIRNTQRVIVVDHDSSDDNLREEAERRKQESAMDANSVADMVTLNSNSILSASLDRLLITKEVHEEYKTQKTSDGKEKKVLVGQYPYIKARLIYTVKITDCETGRVQAQNTYEKTTGGLDYENKCSYNLNQKAAREYIMAHCVNSDDIKVLIYNTFKAKGKILMVDQGNAKKAKTVYINMGSSDGIQKGQKLEVYQEIDIAGEISKKYIGQVEILEVLGDSRCIAKVKKGGDVIQQVLSAGGSLPVETKDVKLKFFGGIK